MGGGGEGRTWLLHPCLFMGLGVEKSEHNVYLILAFPGVSMPTTGRNSRMASSPLHSRAPKIEENGCITLSFSGVPSTPHGEQIK